MRKEIRFIALFAVFILLTSLLPLALVTAQETSPTLEEYGSLTPGEQIEQTVGFNPEKAPKTPQETRDYLQQEWTKIVASKPVIGNIHRFFVAHPLLFKIIFNYPYEFSLTFFLISLLWAFVMVAMASLLSKSELLNGYASYGIGIGTAIIFSHIGALNATSIFLSNLALARDMWWMRLIVWVLIATVFIVLMYIDWAIGEYLKERRKEKAAEQAASTAQQAKKEIEALQKGMKEGLEFKKQLPSDYSI